MAITINISMRADELQIMIQDRQPDSQRLATPGTSDIIANGRKDAGAILDDVLLRFLEGHHAGAGGHPAIGPGQV
ncbi:hypothetical protein, partial [Thermithiobacillus plumbiphilus]